jgi:hypothetical protein
VKFGHECDVQIGQWHLSNMLADVVLIDGPASLEALSVAERSEAERSGAKLVLSTARKRCALTNWVDIRYPSLVANVNTNKLVRLMPPQRRGGCAGENTIEQKETSAKSLLDSPGK